MLWSVSKTGLFSIPGKYSSAIKIKPKKVRTWQNMNGIEVLKKQNYQSKKNLESATFYQHTVFVNDR